MPNRNGRKTEPAQPSQVDVLLRRLYLAFKRARRMAIDEKTWDYNGVCHSLVSFNPYFSSNSDRAMYDVDALMRQLELAERQHGPVTVPPNGTGGTRDVPGQLKFDDLVAVRETLATEERLGPPCL